MADLINRLGFFDEYCEDSYNILSKRFKFAKFWRGEPKLEELFEMDLGLALLSLFGEREGEIDQNVLYEKDVCWGFQESHLKYTLIWQISEIF